METDKIISLISKIRDRANRLISDQLKQRGVKGIVTSHGNILIQLYRHGPLPMNRLADLIGRKKNTLTVLVDKLKNAGYVRLKKSTDDNRITIVELTKKGEDFQQQFQEISLFLLNKVWGDIPIRDRRLIIDRLEKISGNLE